MPSTPIFAPKTSIPCVDKYNRIQYFRGLYKINRNSKQKISLGLTDCKFSWKKIKTAKEYSDFDKYLLQTYL